jgi:hypothetical protein
MIAVHYLINHVNPPCARNKIDSMFQGREGINKNRRAVLVPEIHLIRKWTKFERHALIGATFGPASF